MCPMISRARGEHRVYLKSVHHSSGSSPRTRGTLLRWPCAETIWRFIPAHAGNTFCCKFSLAVSTVHPRARGEHSRPSWTANLTGGSSPRTRGTHFANCEYRILLRFIPAHAGNTATKPRAGVVTAVHPRARGEHRSSLVSPSLHCGSSPRTRGTLGIEPRMSNGTFGSSPRTRGTLS